MRGPLSKGSGTHYTVALLGALNVVVLMTWALMPQKVTWFMMTLQDYVTSEPVRRIEAVVYWHLRMLGVPPPYPDFRDVTLIIFGSIVALVSYWFLLGRAHKRQRVEIQEELDAARASVLKLEADLKEADQAETKALRDSGRKIRIFMEGAFDLMHYGHMNAFRKGRELGTELVVGVNSSDTIAQCKGPPVMDDEERCAMVRACRFVDEVVEGTPYVMTNDYLMKLIEEHDIDYVVHGDDPVIVDGKDVYAHVKKLKKYKSISRTEGVSTTDIVGRMLLYNESKNWGRPSSRFMKTHSIFMKFRGDMRDSFPKDAKIVYIDGDWDLFHSGHVTILEKAKALGDFLVVGVHNDDIVSKRAQAGRNFPILDHHERALSVTGCKYVDNVVFDAPWEIQTEHLLALNVSIVVRVVTASATPASNGDRFKAPRKMGILRDLEASDRSLSAPDIVKRIQENRSRYMAKISKKKKKEAEYYKKRYSSASKASDQKRQDTSQQSESEG